MTFESKGAADFTTGAGVDVPGVEANPGIAKNITKAETIVFFIQKP